MVTIPQFHLRLFCSNGRSLPRSRTMGYYLRSPNLHRTPFLLPFKLACGSHFEHQNISYRMSGLEYHHVYVRTSTSFPPQPSSLSTSSQMYFVHQLYHSMWHPKRGLPCEFSHPVILAVKLLGKGSWVAIILIVSLSLHHPLRHVVHTFINDRLCLLLWLTVCLVSSKSN